MAASAPASRDPFESELIQLCARMIARHSAIEPVIIRHDFDDEPDGAPDSFRTVRVEDKDAFVHAVADMLSAAPVICIPMLPQRYPNLGNTAQTPEDATRHPAHPLVIIDHWLSLESSDGLGRPPIVPQGRRPLVVINAQRSGGVHRVAVLSVPEASDHPNTLHMFRYDSGTNPKVARRQLDQLLKRRSGATPFGYVIQDPAPGLTSLRFDTHDPQLGKRIDSLSQFGSSDLLLDLFEIVKPAHPEWADAYSDAEEPEAARLESLAITGVDHSGRAYRVAPQLEPEPEVAAHEVIELEPGDLLLFPKAAWTLRNGLWAVEIGRSDTPSQAAPGSITLRSKRQITPEHRRLIRAYLTSNLLRAALRAKVPSSTSGYAGLAEITVPRPDDPLAASIMDIDEAANRLGAWLAETETVLAAVFDAPDVGQARRSLVHSGRLLRLRVQGAEAVDDFGHTVRTRYPHPLAYRWRSLDALRDGEDLNATYREILECYEVLLTFVAQIGLTVAFELDEPIQRVAQLRAKLRDGRAGIGLGDWTDILHELSGRRFLDRDLDPALISAFGFMTPNGAFAEMSKRMRERRNDFAHLRRLSDDRMGGELESAYEDLSFLMRRAEFLTDLKLNHVETAALNSFEGTANVTYRQMMGDHSVVPRATDLLPRTDIEVGSLYIVDSSGDWHLSRPFLHGKVCPECHTWSTFHLDSASKGEVILKSLEHGHTMSDPSQRSALERVGLL